jgi:hypothetical protein
MEQDHYKADESKVIEIDNCKLESFTDPINSTSQHSKDFVIFKDECPEKNIRRYQDCQHDGAHGTCREDHDS